MQMDSVETNAGTAICAAAVQDRPQERLLHRHVAVDVLDFHGRVVHEDADRQGHPAQRHDVERLAQAHRTMTDTRIDSGIEMATMSVLRHVPRNIRIIRAVSPAAIAPSLITPSTAARTKIDWSNSELQLQTPAAPGPGSPGMASRTPATTLERGGPFALEDGHQHAAPAVAADDVGLHRRNPSRTLGHVLDVDRDAVDRLDRHVVERGDQVGAAVESDVVLRVADLGGAGRHDEVLIADGRLARRWATGRGHRGVGVEIDHDLRPLAAPGLGHARTLHGAEPLDDEVGGVVEDLLFGQGVAADGDLHDRHAGGAVAGRCRAA